MTSLVEGTTFSASDFVFSVFLAFFFMVVFPWFCDLPDIPSGRKNRHPISTS
jgi:hypothetical protein